MKSDFHNRRVQRTRLLIQQTFLELLGEKGFEAVTIRDISERAKVNRGTFYLHFPDKYALMDQIKEQFFLGVAELSKSLRIEALINPSDAKLAPSFSVMLIEYFQAHHQLLRVMLGPKGDAAFMEKMKQFLQHTLSGQLANANLTPNPSLPAEFVIAYIPAAHLGVLQHWLNSGMRQSPGELASIIYQMTTHGPLRAYFNPV